MQSISDNFSREANRMIKVGDPIPEATLKHLTGGGIEDVLTSDFFAGRKVVLFGVPGAFTPTCAQQHLPDYLTNAQAFYDRDVAEIACMAVNDPFVMAEWGKNSGVGETITMLSDGNGELTKAMGLEFDGSKVGLGTRCKRFAAYLVNGHIKILEIEDTPGVMNVSSAARMIERLDQVAS
jgi:peroxiredoxin